MNELWMGSGKKEEGEKVGVCIYHKKISQLINDEVHYFRTGYEILDLLYL